MTLSAQSMMTRPRSRDESVRLSWIPTSTTPLVTSSSLSTTSVGSGSPRHRRPVLTADDERGGGQSIGQLDLSPDRVGQVRDDQYILDVMIATGRSPLALFAARSWDGGSVRLTSLARCPRVRPWVPVPGHRARTGRGRSKAVAPRRRPNRRIRIPDRSGPRPPRALSPRTRRP